MTNWKLSAHYSGFRLSEPDRGSCVMVSVSGDGPKSRRLTPRLSLRLRNHSPDGFEWGYEGSGPAQLSLALLLDFSGGDAELAQHFYQDFKRDVVGNWPSEGLGASGGWVLAGSRIANWLTRAIAAAGAWREPGGEDDEPSAIVTPEERAELYAPPSMLANEAERARHDRNRSRRGRGRRA